MTRRKNSPEKVQGSEGDYYFPVVDRRLTDHEVFRLVGELRSDRGTPEQARSLIEQFVLASYTLPGPSRELLAFVRDALAEYLETSKSLESAFRLKKGRRGRPNAAEKHHLECAIEFLRRRVVLGESFDTAAENTAESLHASRTIVCEAFARHRIKALSALQDSGAVDMADPVLQSRLAVIFDWFAAPAGSRFNR